MSDNKKTTNKKNKTGYKKMASIIAVALILVLCCYLGFRIYIEKSLTWDDVYSAVGISDEQKTIAGGDVSVTFLDIGQADCTVIRSGGQTVMIDAGERSSADAILAFLKNNKIEKIDYLIATHPHADHIGGMQAVVENCEIAQVIFTNHSNELTPTTVLYTNLLKALLEKEIPTRTASENEKIPLELGELTILSTGNFNDLNNCSIVLRFDYGEASFLFMGDAEIKVENYLLENGADIDADVLKAGHHGSKTGTGQEFIEAVSPGCVVVSVGEGNSYGHPAREFLARVKAFGAEILRTDIAGDIVFLCDGGEPVYAQPAGEAA